MRATRLLSRLGGMLVVLLAIFAVTRGAIRLLPGDPISTLLAETGVSIPAETLRQELGLDRPLLPSLLEDARKAAQGDLGRSILTRQPVSPLLQERFSRTLQLTLLSVLIGGAVAIALGLLAAAAESGGKLSRLADRICTAHGALAAALPVPWIGPILILAFAVKLQWFPLGGHVALPALALAIPFSGVWARLIRERVRESLRLPATAAARARGINEARVLWKYGLAPVSGPLAAYFGTQFGAFLSSGFVAEVIFNYPGMGSLLVDAVLGRDYPVIEAAVFAGASCALLGTRIGDLLHHWLDPRLESE